MDNINRDNPAYIEEPNLLVENKWICEIPWYAINPELKSGDMQINLIDFTIPEVEFGAQEVSYQGAKLTVPNGTREVAQTLTLTYLLDENAKAFGFLHHWGNVIAAPIGAGSKLYPDGKALDGSLMPIVITLLSPMKTPILRIKFHDAWISNIGGLSLTYQGEANVVQHEFSVNFSWMEVLEDN